jgi:hypothetical protein
MLESGIGARGPGSVRMRRVVSPGAVFMVLLVIVAARVFMAAMMM